MVDVGKIPSEAWLDSSVSVEFVILLKLEKSCDFQSYKTVALVSGWKRSIKRRKGELVAAKLESGLCIWQETR